MNKEEKKYCNVISCKAIIEKKYKYCYNHSHLYILGKKPCKNKDCKNWVKFKWTYCYHCNLSNVKESLGLED